MLKNCLWKIPEKNPTILYPTAPKTFTKKNPSGKSLRKIRPSRTPTYKFIGPVGLPVASQKLPDNDPRSSCDKPVYPTDR